MSCHLMRPNILFLFKQCMYDDDVQFSVDLFFFRFIFLSYALIFTLPMENIMAAFKLLFLSGLHLVLFGKITSN